VCKRKLKLYCRVLVKLKDPEIIYVARLIDSDLQKTFSRYTDLVRNQKPESFYSEVIPRLDLPSRPPVGQPTRVPPARPEPTDYTGFNAYPSDPPASQPASMPRPAQPSMNPQPTVHQRVSFPSQPVTNMQPTMSPAQHPTMNPTPAMNPMPNMNPTMNPAMNPQPQKPTMSAEEINAIEKLNAMMKQMDEREQEKKKKEEERRKAEAQYTTAFGVMNPMMIPMFTPPVMPMAYPRVMPGNMGTANPMGFNQGMGNFSGVGMSQPMYTASTNFQVLYLYEG
jgi:hypothetical protein